MLELASLSRAFGGLRVIDGVDFSVEPGEIVGILGPNGAGKTTLFNMIAGVLPPSGGRVMFEGKRHHRHEAVGPLPARHRPHLSDSEALHPYEHVRERAGRGGPRRPLLDDAGQGRSRGGAGAHRPDAHALTPAGQLALLDTKQLELAKALAVKPRLLLLDEIAGGLTEAECDVLLGTIARRA